MSIGLGGAIGQGLTQVGPAIREGAREAGQDQYAHAVQQHNIGALGREDAAAGANEANASALLDSLLKTSASGMSPSKALEPLLNIDHEEQEAAPDGGTPPIQPAVPVDQTPMVAKDAPVLADKPKGLAMPKEPAQPKEALAGGGRGRFTAPPREEHGKALGGTAPMPTTAEHPAAVPGIHEDRQPAPFKPAPTAKELSDLSKASSGLWATKKVAAQSELEGLDQKHQEIVERVQGMLKQLGDTPQSRAAIYNAVHPELQAVEDRTNAIRTDLVNAHISDISEGIAHGIAASDMGSLKKAITRSGMDADFLDKMKFGKDANGNNALVPKDPNSGMSTMSVAEFHALTNPAMTPEERNKVLVDLEKKVSDNNQKQWAQLDKDQQQAKIEEMREKARRGDIAARAGYQKDLASFKVRLDNNDKLTPEEKNAQYANNVQHRIESLQADKQKAADDGDGGRVNRIQQEIDDLAELKKNVIFKPADAANKAADRDARRGLVAQKDTDAHIKEVAASLAKGGLKGGALDKAVNASLADPNDQKGKDRIIAALPPDKQKTLTDFYNSQKQGASKTAAPPPPPNLVHD